jgi:hypothetical protein
MSPIHVAAGRTRIQDIQHQRNALLRNFIFASQWIENFG